MADSTKDQEYIYVKSFYHRGARKRLYAENYGLKAFRLPIRRRGGSRRRK